jgi:hypothetical protein
MHGKVSLGYPKLSSNVFAAWRSAVPKPSVKRP